jgi:hypothetical protein
MMHGVPNSLSAVETVETSLLSAFMLDMTNFVYQFTVLSRAGHLDPNTGWACNLILQPFFLVFFLSSSFT